MLTFPFEGVHSDTYLYSTTPITEASHLSQQPGLYIFASGKTTNPIPVFIASCDRLRDDVLAKIALRVWDDAHATLFYFRIDESKDHLKRQKEYEDLCLRYRPLMNTNL
jgi:hypothetical protein